jgi:hypothetical protein
LEVSSKSDFICYYGTKAGSKSNKLPGKELGKKFKVSLLRYIIDAHRGRENAVTFA